jgi:hypothetical protein
VYESLVFEQHDVSGLILNPNLTNSVGWRTLPALFQELCGAIYSRDRGGRPLGEKSRGERLVLPLTNSTLY